MALETGSGNGASQGVVARFLKLWRVRGLLRFWHRQPIYRILALILLVVAIIPVAIISNHLYASAWKNAWREIQEKHQLLAMNLASPIHIYIEDHKEMLAELAARAAKQIARRQVEAAIQGGLQSAFAHLNGFRMLVLLNPGGETRALVQRGKLSHVPRSIFKTESCYLKTRATKAWALSDIKASPLTGKPTIIMAQPVLAKDKRLLGVLMGELRVDFIESLRRHIHFGKNGHSAIVDKTGHVIAHPNPEWVAKMHDLSALPIVQAMMAGKTGVMEFYSPFIKANMLAGYAAVPDFGWGVMVPQPKSEIEAQVNRLLRIYLVWAGFGLVLALLLAVPLVCWITRPINRLATAAEGLLKNNLDGNLPEPDTTEPLEVIKLHKTLYALVKGLQSSRQEVTNLNASLQLKVADATRKLLESNQRLEQLALCDHLTTLPNRRFFEDALNNALHRRKTDKQDLCLMLIDIDKFKDINDNYGHGAGDLVIKEVAMILSSAMRSGDLVARYGGDEFIAQLHCNYDIGMERANAIRERVEQYAFVWQGQPIQVTVSIGLLYSESDQAGGMAQLLETVDKAMYAAKRMGRNQVVKFETPG